jgi:hypothetical protein
LELHQPVESTNPTLFILYDSRHHDQLRKNIRLQSCRSVAILGPLSGALPLVPPPLTPRGTADLKNTSDDAIPNYLNSLKFRQSHTLVDTRLALGYSAFAISAACFAWDYKLGWDATKNYTAVAVGLYMVVNAALTLWVTFWEKSIVYQGTSPSGEKVRFGEGPGDTEGVQLSDMGVRADLHIHDDQEECADIQRPRAHDDQRRQED